MRYKIVHNTTYCYTQVVKLEPHTVRLRSRTDVTQALRSFAIEVDPEPAGISDIIDWEGNNLFRIWFQEPTDKLRISVSSEVETFRVNPFNYLLEPWAIKLPIDYPASLLCQLQHYFQPLGTPTAIDPFAASLAREIWHKANGQTTTFVSQLNQRIYEHCQQEVRETGPPLPASVVWNERSGSCRDLAMLYIEVCRAMGLAARFVSGYQEGDPDQSDRDLHGWAEVYLPGAGWRGYDPSLGLAVSDRHIVLVASAIQQHTTPIHGIVRGTGVQSEMNFEISIKPVEGTGNEERG